jgi:putative cardiolipin synthase
MDAGVSPIVLDRTRLRWFSVLALVAVSLLGGCTTLDRATARTPSSALSESDALSTTLGGAWSAVASSDPTLSAFRLLPNNLEALAARVAMIDAAERTLDLQYYIFLNDDIGLFLVDRLVSAADRGVRVRILVDDMYAHGIEKGLVAFDAHENIELRIFNPWTQRSGGFVRGFEFLFTPRLNHRMHNKLIVADGIVAILGGRNLADEYFALNEEFDYRDLDVAAVGPVVAGANRLFDEFWNGPDAIPVTGLKPKPDGEAMLAEGRDRLERHRARMASSPYADAVRATEFVQQLKSRSLQWVFASGRVVGDSAEKTTRSDEPDWTQSLASELKDVFYSAKRELLICSPYFVPRTQATERLCDLASTGARVRILTNSQVATDVPVVHAGYSKYRSRLLQGGVELFELRRRGAEVKDQHLAFGSANASLHAKTFVVDRERVFIGSLNLDPRSVVINTEIGVLVESPALAEGVAERINELMLPTWSYRLVRSPSGKLLWFCEDANGQEIRFTTDPETSGWDRFMSGLLGVLPIEGQI